jgi:histidine triad (HIT) family protein
MEECIFCKIVKGEIPTDIEKETDRVVVFKDIHPSAPIHYLIVPKNHIKDIREADSYIWDDVKKVASELAKEKKLAGFRLTTNAGDAALIPHMHIHFLAGITSERSV